VGLSIVQDRGVKIEGLRISQKFLRYEFRSIEIDLLFSVTVKTKLLISEIILNAIFWGKKTILIYPLISN